MISPNQTNAYQSQSQEPDRSPSRQSTPPYPLADEQDSVQNFPSSVASDHWQPSRFVGSPSGKYSDGAFSNEGLSEMRALPSPPSQPIRTCYSSEQPYPLHSPVSPTQERHQSTPVPHRLQPQTTLFVQEPVQTGFASSRESTIVTRQNENQSRSSMGSYNSAYLSSRGYSASPHSRDTVIPQSSKDCPSMLQPSSRLEQPMQGLHITPHFLLNSGSQGVQPTYAKHTGSAHGAQFSTPEAKNFSGSTTSRFLPGRHAHAGFITSPQGDHHVFELSTESSGPESCISPISTSLSSPALHQLSRNSIHLNPNEPIELEEPAETAFLAAFQSKPQHSPHHQSHNTLHLNPNEVFELGDESTHTANTNMVSEVPTTHSNCGKPSCDIPLALFAEKTIEQLVSEIDDALQVGKDGNGKLATHNSDTTRIKIERLLLDILTTKTSSEIENIKNAPGKGRYEGTANRLVRAIDQLRGSADFKDSLRALAYGRIGCEAFWLSTIGHKGEGDTVGRNKKLIDDILLGKSPQEKLELRRWIRTIRPDARLDSLVPNSGTDDGKSFRLESDKDSLKDIMRGLKQTFEKLSPTSSGKLSRVSSLIGRLNHNRKHLLVEEAVLIRRFMNILIRRHWMQVSGEEDHWDFATEVVETFAGRLSIEDDDLVKLCHILLFLKR